MAGAAAAGGLCRVSTGGRDRRGARWRGEAAARSRLALLLAPAVMGALGPVRRAQAQTQTPAREAGAPGRVLVLHPYRPDNPPTERVNHGLRTTLQTRGPRPPDVDAEDVEDLEPVRFADPQLQQEQFARLRHRGGERPRVGRLGGPPPAHPWDGGQG
jgi:hypothetical protein